MSRALLAVALACAVVSPLAFSSCGTPTAPRASAVSFRGTVTTAAPAMPEATPSWVPTFLVSAALGLMVSLASPEAASAEFTKIPDKGANKVSAKVKSKKDRLATDKAKVEKAKKSKLAVYTDNSEAAFVRA
mmetsp:Transcript_14450/g.32834  ORF Transcript_14450/g.32834 Transcript_14450/m.32834 type:complete len:132 (+) Transcript_14450:69-464(+)